MTSDWKTCSEMTSFTNWFQSRHYLLFCTKWCPITLSLVIISLKYKAIFVLSNWTILKLRGCFWVWFSCFSKTSNHHRTCLSLKAAQWLSQETVPQLEFLAWRTGKCCLHFLRRSFPTDAAHLIGEVHQHERSKACCGLTVTICKRNAVHWHWWIIRENVSAGKRFLSPPSYLHRCDEGKEVSVWEAEIRKK